MPPPSPGKPRACPGQETGSQETAPAGATSVISVHDWYRAGLEHGIEIGYEQAEQDMAGAWRSLTTDVLTATDPDSWRPRLRAAEAGCRRDAAEHERAFVAEAFATPPAHRTDVQRATVELYPRSWGTRGIAWTPRAVS